ncbi:MAG: hypothetical protein ACREE4_01455 [Stellaceae bacterium]
MNSHRFALLHPAPRDDAERRHNDAVLGPETLGIEVTVPALAARCGLGNIDPQHTGGGDPRAAIEACLDYEPLPPAGACLVTIRPDLDAFGGMAVLELRARGIPLDPALRERVGTIAKQDRFAVGPWPGSQPLPKTLRELLALETGGETLAPLAAAVADHALAVEPRVASVVHWLEHGELPATHLRAVEQRTARLLAAISSGDAQFDTIAEGRIALVRGSADGLLRLGYCLAPIVIALNPAFRFRGGPAHIKFTVAQYEQGYVDLAGVVRDLSAVEPGWGGSATIIGSPQGRSSRLPFDAVTAAVENRLLR